MRLLDVFASEGTNNDNDDDDDVEEDAEESASQSTSADNRTKVARLPFPALLSQSALQNARGGNGRGRVSASLGDTSDGRPRRTIKRPVVFSPIDRQSKSNTALPAEPQVTAVRAAFAIPCFMKVH
jgi:hypothetical protein